MNEPKRNQPNIDRGQLSPSSKEFWTENGKWFATIAIALILGVAGYLYFTQSQRSSELQRNKELGQAYIYMGQDNLDSAKLFLRNYLGKFSEGLAVDKANLLLGKVYYLENQYDSALQAYNKIKSELPLLKSGAMHGRAAVHMQKGEYDQAVEILENFIASFKRKTRDLDLVVNDEDPADLSPAVPNALWKLALSYQRTGNQAKAEETAAMLVSTYPESEEARMAKRMLSKG